MAFPTKDPTQMRRGALMIAATAPFMLYAAYVGYAERSEPIWATVCVLVALLTLAASVYFLRRAARLSR